jgi:HK97 family phage portal protein
MKFGRKLDESLIKVIVSFFNGNPIWSSRNYETFAKEGYSQNVYVYSCIREIAKAVSCIDFILYEKKGKEKNEIESHDLLNLLQKPNPLMSKYAFIEALVTYIYVSGNLYIKGAVAGGKPRELYLLRPDRVSIIPDNVNFINRYEYSANEATNQLHRLGFRKFMGHL